jgi:hypothetical protein
MTVKEVVRSATKALEPIFSRKCAKRTSSSATVAPPDTPWTPRRSLRILCSPSTTALGTASSLANSDSNVLAVVDHGNRIRSPPSKKVRAARRCCDCTHGMCVYGGGPTGGRNGCTCRRFGRPCELLCARPECQNQGTQSAPPNSMAGSFWKPHIKRLGTVREHAPSLNRERQCCAVLPHYRWPRQIGDDSTPLAFADSERRHLVANRRQHYSSQRPHGSTMSASRAAIDGA